MTFLVMFMNGSDIGGLLVVVLGLAALLLRWTAAPPFLLLIVVYFQLFPFFVPELPFDDPFDCLIAGTALRIGVPLITKDTVISESGLVETVW